MDIEETFIQVITTIDSKEIAEKIAETLLKNHLAGCIQILGPITSLYWWEGKIERSQELMCIIKTKREVYSEVEEIIKKMHPYDVPEIIACPITLGSKDYLDWLESEIKKK